MTEPLALEVIDTRACPDCGVRVDVGKSPRGEQMLLHPMPMCTTYERLDVEAYARLLKRSRKLA